MAMRLPLLFFVVLKISVSVAYQDITFFTAKALPSLTGGYFIGGYSAGDAQSNVGTSFTYGRVIDTGTGDDLPIGYYETDFNDYARRLNLPEGAGRPGVYYCNTSDVSIQTVQVASQAEIHPENQTKTVSWGDEVKLTMTINSTSITESQLKWKHNGVDIEAWNGQSSITITSAKPSDAGIYECYTTQQQRQDGLNGFMRLIVRRCPNGKYGDTCLDNCSTCYNGGICNADTGECICPPGFKGDDCNTGCQNRGTWGKNCGRVCSSSNKDGCRTRMFCVSDPYGCSCLASYTGLDCNTDCPDGKYGAGCTQTCHCTNGCNKSDDDLLVSGECTTSGDTCDDGWEGENCTVPSACPDGLYGELCNYNCHCKNNAPCDKNTGVCVNGDCAPGWINLDTIDSDCQQDGRPKYKSFSYHIVNPGEETYFICGIIGNPVVANNQMKLWKLGTTDFPMSPTTYNDSERYTAVGTFTGVVVQNGDVFFCGAPDIGFHGFSVTLQLYNLPRFYASNKPKVSDSQSDQLTVTWNKWTTDDIGDGPVESYKIYYRESGESDWISGQVIPVSDSSQMSYTSTVTGLQWSTQYEITVTVKRPGPLGEGNKDTTITETTLCATPQAPIIHQVSSPELNQLEVHVQVPDSDGIKCKQGNFDGYIEYIKVRYRKAGTQDEYKGKRKQFDGSVNGPEIITITDDSLQPYTEYEIIAVFRNANVTSPPSDPVTVKTPEDVPSKPRNVTLQPAVYTITVTWLEPDPPNGIITAYKITYWKTNGDNTKKDISIDDGDTNEYNVDNLQYRVHYSVQVSAFTGAGMGEYSDVASIQTTETIPGQLSRIYVLSATENSITVNWTDPVIFSGEIETYGITYKSLHSVYSSTAPVSKDLLVTEPPYTLKGLPAATQFEISVNASTSKGFGEHKTIISGTKIVIDDISVILVPVVVTAPVLTETTATINLRKFDDNVDINKDTEQMKYVVVVEEEQQQQKRDLEENQYIIALFPLNEIPDQLIVGDGMDYNGYDNKPLTSGQQYVIYDGFAVYTTGKEEYIIEKLIEFTAGAVSDPGTSTDTSSGIIGGVIAAVLIVAVVIALVFVLKRRQQNAKTGKKYEEAQMQSTHDENTYANVDESRRACVDGAKWKESSQQNVFINPIKDGDTGELQYMKPERSVKPSKPPKPAVVPLAKFAPVKSIPPKPIIKSRLNSQHVIKIDDLADYIIKKRKENKFVEEYKLLPQSTGTIPHEAAKNPDNKQKNRFRNVLSYDHSRVVLDVINDDPNSDYINANYIDGYQKHKAFIATQGPNGLTVVDFWRMIVQENVTTILMATNLAESGKIKCVQYWPEKGSMKYGSVSVTLEKTKAFPEYSLRTFTVKQGNTVAREVRHFHFTVWPDMSVPIYATGVLNMLEHVNSINDANSGPIVVHCSAGVGRTGSFISIDSMLKMAKAEGCIDVFNFVKRGRENRMNFVQTTEQYEFIHTAVLEAILCGDTSISASDFRQIYGKLQIVDKKTKKSQLQVQWENLGKVSREPRADECEVGTLEENSDKNRFYNVLPFDRRRLRLMTPVYDDDFSTDYVNASFVSAYTVKEAFMVTQMPLPNTIVDLWRMVYDYKSTSIVMLNDMDHNDKTLGQYWPDEGAMQCGPFLVETMKTDKMPNITTRTMHLTNAKGVVTTIQQFQVTCWPADQEFPTSKSVIVDLMSKVERWQQQTGNGPVTVHCINGIGRSGVYCASVSTCDRIKVEQMVDIFQAVKTLRTNRPHMIENMAQYKYCHDIILDYFESFDTYSNFQ